MIGVIGELGVSLGSICALPLRLLVTLVETKCHQAALSVLLHLGLSHKLLLPPGLKQQLTVPGLYSKGWR